MWAHALAHIPRFPWKRASLAETPPRTIMDMNFTATSLIGFFLGFAFGVGCALAVMYSIFLGGYRAALREGQMADPPPRYRQSLARITGRTPAQP